MEAKVNFGILMGLGAAWLTLTLAEPTAALDPEAPETQELAALEDSWARDRSDHALAEAVADAYLTANRPDLAIAALSLATPGVEADPGVAHRLAQAYEMSGRLDDALATADLALSRCARSLGTSGSSSVSPLPARVCTERTYAALDVHQTALSRMVAWGVTDPRDPRARTAYGLAVRAAHISTASR